MEDAVKTAPIDGRRAPLEIEVSDEAIRSRCVSLELRDQDITLARALHEAMKSADMQRLTALFPDLATPHDQADAVAARSIAGLEQPLKAYFAQITACDFSPEALRSSLAPWRQLNDLGLKPETPCNVFCRYLTLVGEEIAKRVDPAERADALAAMQKIVLFNLGLINLLLIREENANFRQMMLYDTATDLPNRFLSTNHLSQEIFIARQEGSSLGFMAVNLIFISRLLGTPGHPGAEDLTRQVAERLKGMLRKLDILGHIGPREFGIILPRVKNEGQAMLAANKVQRTLEDPFKLGNLLVKVQSSIGICLHPAYGHDADTLIKLAETAGAEASRTGIPYVVYRPELDEEDLQRKVLELELREAMEGNELMLYFQPQMDLKSGRIDSAEALVRWKNRRDDFIPAHSIVEMAESSGLMSALTIWVVNTALRQCASLRRDGIDLRISVNLSASNLAESELPEFIEQALKTWSVPPDRLMLELTEGSMIQDMGQTLDVMLQLKSIGVLWSIDDFGTGYSSLAYLRKLPVHELKIDQAFVHNMLKVAGDASIVRTVLDLAHNFGLEAVAEGVEDAVTMQALKDLGCDKIQGYYLSRAVPEEDFKAWWIERTQTAAVL
jgi:diguanylate cyclase